MAQITFQPAQLANLDFSKPARLVIDHGIYIMTGKGEIAYCLGGNPDTDPNWWDKRPTHDDEVTSLNNLKKSGYSPDRSIKVKFSATRIAITQKGPLK